jgi:hypothetical protein
MLERVHLDNAESVANDHVFIRLSQLRVLQLFRDQPTVNIRIISIIRAKRINLCKIKLINQSNICGNLLVQGIITVAKIVTYADILRQPAI